MHSMAQLGLRHAFAYRTHPALLAPITGLLLLNPIITILKPQNNGPLYNNTVIGTLAVDGWAVTFGTAMRGLGGAAAHTQAPP